MAEATALICGEPCYLAALAYADRVLLVASQRPGLGALLAAAPPPAAGLPGAPRAVDVRALMGRRGGGDGGEGGGDGGGGDLLLQALVARRLAERLLALASGSGAEAERPLLLAIALGARAEASGVAAAREVVDALASLAARVGVIGVEADAPAAALLPFCDPVHVPAAVGLDTVTVSPAFASSVLVPMLSALREAVRQALPTFEGFPRPGILFVDVLPLWRAPALLRPTLVALAEAIVARFGPRLDFLAGLEARGFLFQSVALHLGLPFVAVRKPGKLPGATVKHAYTLEYGTAELQLQVGAVAPGERGVIVDDLLATGGTVGAAAALLRACGAVPAGVAVLVDIGIGGARNVGLEVLAVLQTT